MTTLQMFSKITTDKSSALCISSDVLALFACSFAALIHDVRHPGVPNFVLKNEDPSMASRYKDRCIAEQHSFELAWDLLSEDRFADLRGAILCNEEESIRFRQLVVNATMATDLFDPELCDLRTKRWKQAFGVRSDHAFEKLSSVRATVLFEHVIQASDISHTMQHWYVSGSALFLFAKDAGPASSVKHLLMHFCCRFVG